MQTMTMHGARHSTGGKAPQLVSWSALNGGLGEDGGIVERGWGALWGIISLASVGASAYHGYKRNHSIGWAAAWGVLGGVFPIITPAVAIAQGFGERK